MGVQGKRSGTLRPPSKKKRGGADPEQQLEHGQVPAEQQAEHVEPPKNSDHLTEVERFTLLAQQPLDNLKRLNFAIADADETLKGLKSERSTFFKKMKVEFGATAPDDLRDMLAMEDPEREAQILEDIKRRAKLAEFMASDLPLFSGQMEPDREPAVDKASRIGRSEALRGARFDPSRYGQGTEQLRAYEAAYYKAQAERLMTLGKVSAPPPPIGDAPATHTDAEAPPVGQEEWPAEGQPPKPQAAPEEVVAS